MHHSKEQSRSQVEFRARECSAEAREGAAFTLIELLVTIAIIGILAGLLAAGLRGAKLAADSATCRNNLRQISIATQVYTDSYEGYPMVLRAYPDPNDPPRWYGLIAPQASDKWPEYNYEKGFVAGRGIFACPGYNRIKGVYMDTVWQWGSYGFNAAGRMYPGAAYAGDPIELHQLGLGGRMTTQNNWSTWTVSPTRAEAVRQPSDMVMNGDATLSAAMVGNIANLGARIPAGGADRFCPGEYPDGGETDPMISDAYRNRHGGKSIVSFTDAHVEGLRPEKLFDQWNPSVIRRWNIDGDPHN